MLTRLFTLVLLALIALPLSAATTLKIATLAPDGTSWMKQMRSAAKQIEKETEGRVKLRFYPGGVMGNDNSVLRKIRVGQLHGGAITGGGLSSVYPDAQVYTLPFQFRDLQEVDAVRRVMDPLIIEGLHKAGYVSFGLSEGGFAYLLANTPVQTTDDMHNLKIWIPEGDEINARMFKALGIAPIPLPMTDVMTGLQTGLIDTIASSPIGAIALQWHTRVKYLTEVPLAYLYATLVITEKSLARLEDADRSVVTRTLQETFSKLDAQNRQDNRQALDALQGQGIEFVEPSLSQRQEWEKHANTMLQALSDKGLFDAAMLKQMQQLIQAARSTSANL
ncbi:MAG: TRAP transporter substrate-binding protein DctP [Candidatus Thiodiazotropha sp.]